MKRSNIAAILLLGTLVSAIAAAALAVDELSWNRLSVAQVASEPSVPKVKSPPPATDAVPSPYAAGPAAPADVIQLPPPTAIAGEPAGTKGAVPLRDPTQPGEQLRDLVAPREGWMAEWSRRSRHDHQTHHSTILRNSIRAARSLGDISVAKRQTAAKAAFALSGTASRRPQLVQTLVQTVVSTVRAMPS